MRKYELSKPEPADFVAIPNLDISIAMTKTRASDGRVLFNINWYETKLLVQNMGLDYALPTSSQWGRAIEYLLPTKPALEADFWVDNYSQTHEWVDSLLAFPNEKGEYSPRLKIPGIARGKVPLLIEESRIERDGETYVALEGRVREVPDLPVESGYIQEWNEDLGLPVKIDRGKPNEKFQGELFIIDSSYDWETGLRAMYRCQRWSGRDWKRRYGQSGSGTNRPSEMRASLGFRLIKRLV